MDLVFNRLDETVAQFTLSGATPAFANTLRRTMIGEVPTLAIEDVRIFDNTSVLFDEILAHRIGLIPIKTDLSRFVQRNKCSCNGAGCPLCTVTFTLSVEGPKMVMSSDLISNDPDTIPVNGNIPIVKLWENQKIILEATAELNIGLEHAKWQPTLACGYKEYPIINISDNCDMCGKCVDECPRKVLEIPKKGIVQVRVVNGESKDKDCSMCCLCETICKDNDINKPSSITIGCDSSKFIFVVESDGSLPVKEIIQKALYNIKSHSSDMVDALKDIPVEGL